MDIRVEVEGIKHSGVSKSSKPYFILTAYVFLPDMRHPLPCDLFSDKALNPGLYSCPVEFSVVDKRPSMQINLSAATAVKASPDSALKAAV